jgi:hypothetical protein
MAIIVFLPEGILGLTLRARRRASSLDTGAAKAVMGEGVAPGGPR